MRWAYDKDGAISLATQRKTLMEIKRTCQDLSRTNRKPPQRFLSKMPIHIDDEGATEDCGEVYTVVDAADFIPSQGRRPLTDDEKYLIGARSIWHCVYCGDPHLDGGGCYDHVIPVCDGGWTSFENVVFCCQGCNSLKGRGRVCDLRHKLSLRELGWPRMAPEVLAWAESQGLDIGPYRNWKFWFERADNIIGHNTLSVIGPALERDKMRMKEQLYDPIGRKAGVRWNTDWNELLPTGDPT